MDLYNTCEICSGLLDEEDLFCANCGKSVEVEPTVPQYSGKFLKHSFDCGGCGASMSYDASVQTLRCPYCGSESLQQSRSNRCPTPSRIVPFRVSDGNAQQLLTSWLGRGFWRPGDLSKASTLTKMIPVYVPFWVFSASTHTYWTADSGNPPFGSSARWYPVTGENRNSYQGLLVGASSVLTPDENQAISPFDLSNSVAIERFNLDQSNAEQFTVPRKYARPLARQGLEEQERLSCAQKHLGSSYRNLRVNVRIEELTSVPYLMPVWVMAYRYQNQLYRILINGQTGRIVGKAPFSWAKLILLLIFFAILIILFVAMSAM